MISTILANATIVDGTGHPPYTTDLAVAGDRIALIGDLRDREAVERIDCGGAVLAPGFIDVHSHSDELWLALPRCDGKIAQGVTTEIGGNCGTSIAPLHGAAIARAQHDCEPLGIDVSWRTVDEFFACVERNGVAMNVASLVGLGTTRRAIAGDSEKRLDAAQIAAQARLVREACEQGAVGVSSGLIYPPSSYADLTELVAMAEAARDAGAPLYASHVRSEGDESESAIAEALEVGARAAVAVQCSHHKAAGKRNWGKVHGTLAMIEGARQSGHPAHCDVYPYVASWTDLATILPDDVRLGGMDATLQRLNDPHASAAIALALHLKRERDWHDIMITNVRSERNAFAAGMRLDDFAQRRGLPPVRAAIALLAEERLDVAAVFFTMCEDDVATVLSADFCCIGSDASVRALDGPTARGVPHPRTFGTFPRVLGRYVRERRTVDLPEAIRKMSSLPAAIFGLRDRGTLTTGKYADLVVFDQASVRDEATYERPYAFPTGVRHVYVNGRAVVRDGALTNERPGRVLRNGYAR